MKLRGNNVLFNSNDGGGGGSDDDAGKMAVQELRAMREKYRELKSQYNEVVKAQEKTQQDFDQLTRKHEETQKKLGEYTALDARKAALEKALEHSDVKGKLNVDKDKAMRYLNRLPFDDANLENDVREAIEMFGSEADQKASSLPSRGAGSDHTDRKPTKSEEDPLGAMATRMAR